MTPTPYPCPASLWLASGSPRRRELLEQAGFVIAGRARPAGEVDESLLPGERPDWAVLRLARTKLEAGMAASSLSPGAVLLAADTLVAGPDGRPMGKPVDAADAEAMLATLSGQWHRVITAVAVGTSQIQREAVVESRLRFARLTPETIRAYVGTGEPLDKAGGYGLQGRAGSFVEAIDGDCSAVIGLPLSATCRLLAAFDIQPAWMERGDMGQDEMGQDDTE